MSRVPYIVVDTNVLISAGILPKSRVASMLAKIFDRYTLAQNEATWEELRTRIQKPKLDRYFSGENDRFAHLAVIARNAQHFPIVATANRSADATDDKFLALAIDAGAQFIISGDSDLKDIKVYEGISICSPAQFMDLQVSMGH
jgi:putative PIN family toxin of toxin-antitoxin system